MIDPSILDIRDVVASLDGSKIAMVVWTPFDEYMVVLWVNGVAQESASYYTDDYVDSRGTARLMVGRDVTYMHPGN